MTTSLQRRPKFITRTIAALFIISLIGINAFAATFTSTGTGSWATPAIWSITNGNPANNIPGTNDNVVILAGHSITITDPAIINSLTVTGTLSINIPNGALTTTDVALNPSATIGNITITTGNLRVEDDFYLTNLLVTIDGASSSVTFGGDKDFVRTTEYFRVLNAGKLIMENIGKGKNPKRQYNSGLGLGNILFPIGTTDGTSFTYTPVYINNRDQRQATVNATFSATVTNGLRTNGTDGPMITSNAVNRTWAVAVLFGDADAEIYVKWNQPNELPNFSAVNSLIALYQDGGWDQFVPSNLDPATRVSSIAGVPALTNIVANQTSLPKTFPVISIHGNGLNPLPVELTSFTAVRKNAEVALNWETASEKNCKGFEIQTSEDGKNYKALDFINSQNGNSTTAQRYAYTHKTGNREGLIYYRLKQVDLDGTVAFYHAKVVNLGRFTYTASTFPNPFQEKFKLELEATEAGLVDILIKDITGRTIVHNQPIVVKGTNTIDVSLTNAPAGVYLIQATSGDRIYTNRIVKQ